MSFFDESRVGLARYRRMELDAQVYVDPTETFTVVTISGERYTGVGVSKRNPADSYDAQVGWDIACARALRELAEITEGSAGQKDEEPPRRQFTYVPIDVKVYQ